MSKKIVLLVLLMLIFTLASCTKKNQIEAEIDPKIESIAGLDDVDIMQYEYFNPLKDVVILNEKNENISYLMQIEGNVHYGKIGSYELTYKMQYGNDEINEKRTVHVVPGTIVQTPYLRNTISGGIKNLQFGSYQTGALPSIDHPISPRNIHPDLLNKAVPSNGWWTSLLVQNYGDGNGIYTNPLRSSFLQQGVEVTNPGEGFVQYWNPGGYQTMANFSLALPDLFVKTNNLNQEYQTQVIDYSDKMVSVAMRNQSQLKDQMVVTYTQGSPYIYFDVAESKSPYVTLASNGVFGYEFYQLDGTKITDNAHTGEAIIVALIQKHVGYQTTPPQNVGQPTYKDRFFIISAPKETVFSLSSKIHPSNQLNHIEMDLANENYFSIAAIDSISDATFFHNHAYLKPVSSDVSFRVIEDKSVVETYYHTATQKLMNDKSGDLATYLLPHHLKYTDHELTDYEFETVRSHLKLMLGHSFMTTQSFYGVLPAMTLPNNSEFSKSTMESFLLDLDMRTELSDTSNFINEEGPYWNSKAIYPLTQGIIIADQINNDNLKQGFIAKLRYILADWFTYQSSSDKRFLYYNKAWGSVYYSNNDFNTATELSDHSFTHGYLIYAASVLSFYDSSFKNDYGQIVDLLLNDYMYPEKENYEFQYLRSFDPWAGHTWAHGFGTFAEGNNIESSSEAILSWVGGYLWALGSGDEKRRDAAIYGFVHELNSAKMYMFDYDQNIFKDEYSNYASVAGMIWGGKYDYATWFGANPTFIYGIQWLPNGEYLSSYALNDFEKTRLTEIFSDYLNSKNNVIDTWYANMWSIQALINPSVALAWFDANKIINDDYPSDLAQTYYLINGLKSYGQRSTSFMMEVHPYVASSIYYSEEKGYYALVFNGSQKDEDVYFINQFNERIKKTVPKGSLTAISLS